MDKREYRKCQWEKRTRWGRIQAKRSTWKWHQHFWSFDVCFFMLSSHFCSRRGCCCCCAIARYRCFGRLFAFSVGIFMEMSLRIEPHPQKNPMIFPFSHQQRDMKNRKKHIKWHHLTGYECSFFGWCYPKCGIHRTVDFFDYLLRCQRLCTLDKLKYQAFRI